MEEKHPDTQSQITCHQMLSRDTGIGPEDLGNAILDRDLWKTVFQNIPASGAEGWWWVIDRRAPEQTLFNCISFCFFKDLAAEFQKRFKLASENLDKACYVNGKWYTQVRVYQSSLNDNSGM